MATYADLQLENHYLIQEMEGDDIQLIQPVLATNSAVLLLVHEEYERFAWKKKKDVIFEIVDELTEEQVALYEDLFEDEDDDEEDWD